MQTIVRLIVGFVTHTLGQKAPTTAVTVDTNEADQAWWEQELAEIKGDWYMEEVPGTCLSCPQSLHLMRWQTSGYGDQCDRCIATEASTYQEYLAACEAEAEAELEAAWSVKVSF